MRQFIDRAGWAVAGALGLALILALASIARGGPLDPTAAPGSTDSVRLPGTPISALPYTINAPGRYYLTRHLVQPSSSFSNGITIAASDVTLDLGGFTLAGATEARAGIIVQLSRQNIVVRNGTVRGWGDFGLTEGGVDLSSVQRAVVEDLAVTDNFGDGLRLGANGAAARVTAIANTGDGINAGADNVIRDSRLMANGGDGIEASAQNLVTGNRVSGHDGAGDVGIRMLASGNVVAGNYLWDNATGVHLDSPAGGNKVVRNFSTSDVANYTSDSLSDFIAPEQPIASATNPFANQGE